MNKTIQHALLGALTGGAVDTAIGAGTAMSSREYKRMKPEDKKGLLAHSALVGGIAGAGVGLLEGPIHALVKRGSISTLKVIADKLEIKDDIKKTIGQLLSNPPKFGNAAKKGYGAEKADPRELAIGMVIEREHSPHPGIRRNIALDHMSEFPKRRYYSKLLQIERSLKKSACLERISASLNTIGVKIL